MHKLLKLLLLLNTSVQALAAPVDGCTFYKTPWKSKFLSCAEPTIQRRICTKIKGVCPACVKYKGDRGAMFLPDYLIEVTEHYGKSLFSSTTSAMASHLNQAVSYYDSKTKGLASGFTDKGGEDPLSHSTFWHARLLQTPYSIHRLSYLYLKSAGNAVPVCYSGISEFLFDQWQLGLSDLPFAMAWAPIGLVACYDPKADIAAALINEAVSKAKSAASNALSSIVSTDSSSSSVQGCAYAVNAKVAMTMNLNPSSDALNFSKLCMGSLGNLVPREGHVTSEERFRSAVIAAWKFSSLVKDVYGGSVGAGIEYEDKWQLVYPAPAVELNAGCWKAGNIFDVNDIANALLAEKRNVIGDNSKNGKENTYVFAIWKQRKTSCLEPEVESNFWLQSVKAQHKANEATCL